MGVRMTPKYAIFSKLNLNTAGTVTLFALCKSLADPLVQCCPALCFLAWFCTGATPLIIPTSRYTKHGRHALQTEPVLVLQHKLKSRYF